MRATTQFGIIALAFAAGTSAAQMYGSDQFGNLIQVNLGTGAGTLIGTETNYPLSTEIEYGQGQMFSEEVNGFINLHTVSLANGLSTGFVTHNTFAAFNGMEFVGNTLYAAAITGSGGPSTLITVNTATGVETTVGLTGSGPITGLAYDTVNSIMYGVTGGGGVGTLLNINLGNGVATPGPVITDASGQTLTHIGALEFGANGVLYGGVGLSGAVNPGWLFSVDPTTGIATWIGPTGLPNFGGYTGLTLVPAPGGVALLGVGGLVAARRRR